MADPRIELGARVCMIIKRARYNDEPWADCYKKVAKDFSMIKAVCRKRHEHCKTEVDYLKTLGNYCEDDIRDMLNHQI